MTSTVRLVATLVALALPGAVLGNWLIPLRTQGTFSLDGIPNHLAEYRQMAEEELDPAVIAQIAPDDYLMRLYSRDDGVPIWLYLGLYSGSGSKGAHNPTSCYPAQGWEITAARDVTVAAPGGERIRARVLTAMRDGRNELVLYWFQAADRWPRSELEEQLLRVYDSLRGAPQYAFVRLSAQFSGEAPDEALLRFAGELAPHVRSAVGSDELTQHE